MSNETIVVKMSELDEMVASAVLEDAISTIKKQFNTMVNKKDISSSLSISVSMNIGEKCSTYTNFEFNNFELIDTQTVSSSEDTSKSSDSEN